MVRKRIPTEYGKSKASARKSTRAKCAWDSGSVIVLVTDLLMRTRAIAPCPGSTWKKYLHHRFKKSRLRFFSEKMIAYIGHYKLDTD